jgi:diguanylate cyclase (GGDEF)-like protein/PAS domain S-box-containing protein
VTPAGLPSQTTVLLVEEDPREARELEDMLESEIGDSLRINRVDRVADAEYRVAGADLACLLLDLSAAGAEGPERLHRLADTAPELPIVALIDAGDNSSAAAALEAGAQDYVVKGGNNGRALAGAVRWAIDRKRAEREARFKGRALDHVDAAVVGTDEAGAVNSWNRGAEKLWGWSAEEARGKSWVELAAPETPRGTLEAIQRRLAAGKDWEGEFDILRKDGTTGSAFIRGAALRDSSGRVTGFNGVAIDLTDYMRAPTLRSEERYRRMIETTHQGVWMTDADRRTTYVNRTMTEMLGYSWQEMIGREPEEFASEDGRAQTAVALERRRQGVSEQYENKFRHKDGRDVWFLISGTPLTDQSGDYAGALAMMADITERKSATVALLKSEALKTAMLETALDCVITIDDEGTVREFNQAAVEVFGYKREEAIGSQLADLIVPEEQREAHRRGMARYLETGEERILGKRMELTAVRADGTRLPVELRVWDIGVDPPMFTAFVRDITTRRRVELDLQQQAAQQAAVAELGQRALGAKDLQALLDDAVTLVAEVLDVEYAKVLELQPDGEEFLLRAGIGWSPTTVGARTVPNTSASQAGHTLEAGKPIKVEDEQDTRFAETSLLDEHDVVSGVSVVIEGKDRPFGVLSAHSKTRQQLSSQEVSFVQNVANVLASSIEGWRSDEEIRTSALRDRVTGLPNRTLFLDRLQYSLAASTSAGSLVAVLLIDLDHFKIVNDTFGRESADGLLRAFGERAARTLSSGDTVACLGGDVFAVLLRQLPGEREAIQAVDSLQQSLAEPFTLDGQQHLVTASVGVAVSPTAKPKAADALLQDAEGAMYRAKERGRGRYELFDPDLRGREMRRLRIEQELRRALDEGELRLFYQPIVVLEDGARCGAEALLRWEHPERGLLAPGEFMSVAEESGLIVPIGRWVLEEAARQAAVWRATPGMSNALPVHVNLAARQLEEADLAIQLGQVLSASEATPNDIGVEITESALIEDAAAPTNTLRALRDLGIHISLDDFGTGYSALSYLQRFPIDTLKIDRSFIAPLDRANRAPIVEAIVAMAHALHMSVVAEGVETAEQAAEVRRLGCDFAQGFYFSRPAPAEQMTGAALIPVPS